MIRRIAIVATTIGAAACAGAWGCSIWSTIQLARGDRLMAVRGGILEACNGPPGWLSPEATGLHPPDSMHLWPPGIARSLWRDGTTVWDVWVPLWIPFLIFAAYPTVAFIRGPLRRWRRTKAGACARCGYDLTANESGVCPECGSAVDASLQGSRCAIL